MWQQVRNFMYQRRYGLLVGDVRPKYDCRTGAKPAASSFQIVLHRGVTLDAPSFAFDRPRQPWRLLYDVQRRFRQLGRDSQG
jgi:hypothetical protein